MIRNKPKGATVYGVDLGKNVFHVVGTDKAGNIIQRVKFRRDTVLAFFQQAAPALVGMEACPGAQWLARKLQAMGHTVRVVPAQFVKPYVKTNKNDMIDAEAIAEAITRPTMRFVEVKTTEQVDIQALHRIRDQMVRNRTRLICQMRAFCLEHGVAIRQGAGVFKLDLPRVIADLDKGRLRVASQTGSAEVGEGESRATSEAEWTTHAWVKQAILLYFAVRKMEKHVSPPFEFYDKVPLKSDLESTGVRVVPGAVARFGAHIESGAILMPSFVNIGAYVGAGTMVDTWATVG